MIKAENIIIKEKYKGLKNLVLICDAMDEFAKQYHKEQLTLNEDSQQRELLMATLTSRVLTIQNEPDGIVRETMINNLLIDINIHDVSQQRELLKSCFLALDEVSRDNAIITDEDAFIDEVIKDFNKKLKKNEKVF